MRVLRENSNTAIAVRNSAYSLISLGFRFFGNLVFFVIIARLPSIQLHDFGQLTYGSALASLFVLVSQFGLLPLLIREIAADSSLLKLYARSAIALRLLLSAVGFGLLVAYVNLVDLGSQAKLVCYITALALYIGSFSIDLQALFQSKERMHFEVFGIAMENMVLFLFALIAFWVQPGIVQIALIFLFAKSLSFVLNYVICGRHLLWVFPVINVSLWRRLLERALPFALTSLLAAGIVQIDTVLLRELAPDDPEAIVGIYQAAARLFLIPMFLPEIVLKVFLPQLSRMHGIRGAGLLRDLGRVNHVLLTLGILIGCVVLFRGQDIVELIYGQKYAAAGPLLQVLGVTIMMRFSAAYNLYYTIRGLVWFRVFSALIAIIAVVVFNWILIPRYGAMGSAYASVIAHAIYLIPYIGFFYREERTVTMGWNFVGAAGVAGVLAVILWLTSGINVIFMLPVYTVLCGGGVLVTMSAENRARILSQFGWKGEGSV